MMRIHKQIITNEAMEPVGVIIDYQDWQKIEAILEQRRLLDNSQNLMSFTGTVQLTIDPLTFQQQERETWS